MTNKDVKKNTVQEKTAEKGAGNFDDRMSEYLYVHREFISKTRIDLDNSFDKYILTFSTGSLYLSIVFTKSFDDILKCKSFLMFGWGFFVISVITMLLSILYSVKAYEHEEEILKNMIENEAKYQKNKYSSYVDIFENIGIITFILGIILLTVFYFINI